MPSNNRVVLASAGSGKTTRIVKMACEDESFRAALVTYTINSTNELSIKAADLFGAVPSHVRVSSWFTFLLEHFVRPYQNYLYDKSVTGLCFPRGNSAPYVRESDVRRYFFSNDGRIYSDKVSKFSCKIIEKSDGLPLHRLGKIFDAIYVDECQDLSGWDLELMQYLVDSDIAVTLVGDVRQATYSTNSSRKNRKYKGANIGLKFTEWEKRGVCEISYDSHSYRCTQAVCDLADSLYPDAPATSSRNVAKTNHDGVFVLQASDVEEYFEQFRPQVLRYDRRTKNVLGSPMNFGAVKGMTFGRVLIYPHGPLKKFLNTGDLADAGESIAKIYVAVTRARQSVAFVVEDGFRSANLPLYDGS